MGSYGDVWLNCAWCGKWGKCPPPYHGACISLIDVDMIGPMCMPCLQRGCQPHPDWLVQLLPFECEPEVLNCIAEYASNPVREGRAAMPPGPPEMPQVGDVVGFGHPAYFGTHRFYTAFPYGRKIIAEDAFVDLRQRVRVLEIATAAFDRWPEQGRRGR